MCTDAISVACLAQQLTLKPQSRSVCVCLFASEAEKRQTSQMEKLYLRIPTSVDAITFTMQNGNYNAILLTKCVIDFSIYVL